MLLAISPAETVEFDMVSKRQAFVKVSNPNDFACAFKVLVTAPQRYRVKPATGVVAAGAAVEVHLTLTATELVPEKEWARDKFQFRMARFNEHSGASFWQHVADEDIEQTKLRCRHLSNGVSSAGAQREEKQEERPFRKGFASPPPSLDQPIREASPPAEATGEVTRGGESCSLEENSAEEVEQPRPLSLDAREGDSSQRAQAEATANAETLAAEAERGAAAAAAPRVFFAGRSMSLTPARRRTLDMIGHLAKLGTSSFETLALTTCCMMMPCCAWKRFTPSLMSWPLALSAFAGPRCRRWARTTATTPSVTTATPRPPRNAAGRTPLRWTACNLPILQLLERLFEPRQ